MLLFRSALRAFSVALLILCLTVVASAQSVAQTKEQATAGGTRSQAQVSERGLSGADSEALLSQIELALPKWETALKNIDPEKAPQISYSLGKAIADKRNLGLMEVGNIRLYVAKQRVKRTVSGELALFGFLQSLYDLMGDIVGLEVAVGLTLSSLEKFAPELGALCGRIGDDVYARVALLEKGSCP